MNISVVIPVYNEEKNILPLYESLKSVLGGLNTSFEIIFVDDGSKDRSPEVLREIKEKDPCVRIVRMKNNYGQSAALDAGFKESKGEIIISLDADLQNDPQDIPRLLSELGDCDVVCGWRKKRNDTLSKRISSRIANGVRRMVLGDDIIDIGCTLRAYRRKALEAIKLYNGLHRFLPVLIEWEGFKVKQIPVEHNRRLHGKSKYKFHKRLVKPFLDLWAVLWMKKNLLKYELK
jgi:glycosyltransferase involved in cell wall biosynthesis